MVMRFLVPLRRSDATPRIPKWINPLEVEIRAAQGQAEILVDDKAAAYLSKRDYAIEVSPPEDHLSWSQINMFMRCPRSYYFRYVTGLKIPPNSALAVGQTLHKTAERNNVQKITTKEDISLKEAKEIFSDEWDKLAPTVAFEEGENPGEVKDSGISLVELLMREVAPSIMPIAAEQEFNLEFDNAEYKFKGIIDVITEEGIIVDFKTVSKTPAQDAIDSDRQITTYYLGYRMLYGEPPKGAWMDYLIKTKTPKHVRFETLRTADDETKLLSLIAEVSRAIRGGYFYPNITNERYCNPRWCGYWNLCQGGGGEEWQ